MSASIKKTINKYTDTIFGSKAIFKNYTVIFIWIIFSAHAEMMHANHLKRHLNTTFNNKNYKEIHSKDGWTFKKMQFVYIFFLTEANFSFSYSFFSKCYLVTLYRLLWISTQHQLFGISKSISDYIFSVGSRS